MVVRQVQQQRVDKLLDDFLRLEPREVLPTQNAACERQLGRIRGSDNDEVVRSLACYLDRGISLGDNDLLDLFLGEPPWSPSTASSTVSSINFWVTPKDLATIASAKSPTTAAASSSASSKVSKLLDHHFFSTKQSISLFDQTNPSKRKLGRGNPKSTFA